MLRVLLCKASVDRLVNELLTDTVHSDWQILTILSATMDSDWLILEERLLILSPSLLSGWIIHWKTSEKKRE